MKNKTLGYSLLIALFMAITVSSGVFAQSKQKLPDCCAKSQKEGKLCETYPQALKAGALSFKLNYTSLFSKDPNKLFEFYGKILQYDPKDVKVFWKGNNPNGYVEVPTLGSVLSFTKKADVINAKGNIMLEFGTTLDIEQERKRIMALGVEMVPDFKIKNMIRFYDPDGNIVNIYGDPHIPLRVSNGAELNADVVAKMPDCCKQFEKTGNKPEYATQPYRTSIPPHAGATLYRLGYVSLFTKDIHKLYDFYKDVLKVEAKDIKDLSSENDFNSYFEVPTQKAVLSFSYKADATPNNGIVLLEMECQNSLESEYQRIKALGVKMKDPARGKNEFKFYDPDGNMINCYHYCLNFYRQIPNPI
jgi:predicted enzyme related to lactoylglutathione lyase